MAHPFHHSLSSVKKWGGKPEDYLHIHEFFDQTKAHLADSRHRAVLHNSFGIFLCQQVFGPTLIRKSDGREIPVRFIGEQHVLEDLGCIPTLADWMRQMPEEPWMAQRTLPVPHTREEVETSKERAKSEPPLADPT